MKNIEKQFVLINNNKDDGRSYMSNKLGLIHPAIVENIFGRMRNGYIEGEEQVISVGSPRGRIILERLGSYEIHLHTSRKGEVPVLTYRSPKQFSYQSKERLGNYSIVLATPDEMTSINGGSYEEVFKEVQGHSQKEKYFSQEKKEIEKLLSFDSSLTDVVGIRLETYCPEVIKVWKECGRQIHEAIEKQKHHEILPKRLITQGC